MQRQQTKQSHRLVLIVSDNWLPEFRYIEKPYFEMSLSPPSHLTCTFDTVC